MTTDFTVSIRLMTYNHEAFIAEAMKGIMMQKTNFKVEVVVGDDFSQDKTLNIINSFEDTELIKVRILDRVKGDSYWVKRQKLGRLYNFTNILENCKGKYIALLDGDDYWTDPYKLQKQIDFLEQNPDVNLVHTDIDWLDETTGKIIKKYYKSIDYKLPEIYDIKTFLYFSKIRALTICFRASAITRFNNFFNNSWTVGDTALIMYATKNKKIGYINQSTGVYRRGIDTASAKKSPEKQFEYWLNASSKVKYFFYDYLKLDDRDLKKHLDKQYYNSMLKVAIAAKKFKFILKACLYKLIHLQLTKSNLKQLFNGLILNKS